MVRDYLLNAHHQELDPWGGPGPSSRQGVQAVVTFTPNQEQSLAGRALQTETRTPEEIGNLARQHVLLQGTAGYKATQ